MVDGQYTWTAVLHHQEIFQFFDFQYGGCLPSWNFETETLTAIYFRDTLCIITLNSVETGRTEISQFFAFFSREI